MYQNRTRTTAWNRDKCSISHTPPLSFVLLLFSGLLHFWISFTVFLSHHLPRPHCIIHSTNSHWHSVDFTSVRGRQYLHFFIYFFSKLWSILLFFVSPLWTLLRGENIDTCRINSDIRFKILPLYNIFSGVAIQRIFFYIIEFYLYPLVGLLYK